jgi:hypothetical protein
MQIYFIVFISSICTCQGVNQSLDLCGTTIQTNRAYAILRTNSWLEIIL